jgi:hypothetical protein
MMIIWDEHEWIIILNYASQVYWALLLLVPSVLNYVQRPSIPSAFLGITNFPALPKYGSSKRCIDVAGNNVVMSRNPIHL